VEVVAHLQLVEMLVTQQILLVLVGMELRHL
jgi:hypothetical protein